MNTNYTPMNTYVNEMIDFTLAELGVGTTYAALLVARDAVLADIDANLEGSDVRVLRDTVGIEFQVARQAYLDQFVKIGAGVDFKPQRYKYNLPALTA